MAGALTNIDIRLPTSGAGGRPGGRSAGEMRAYRGRTDEQ